MTRFLVVVDGAQYEPAEDVPTTRAAIDAARAAGGDYIRLRRGETTVLVLISPRSSVVIRERASADKQPAPAPAMGGTAMHLVDDLDDWGL